MILDAEIEMLRLLSLAATPEPWIAEHSGASDEMFGTFKIRTRNGETVGEIHDVNNAALVVQARSSIPRLLEAIESLRASWALEVERSRNPPVTVFAPWPNTDEKTTTIPLAEMRKIVREISPRQIEGGSMRPCDLHSDNDRQRFCDEACFLCEMHGKKTLFANLKKAEEALQNVIVAVKSGAIGLEIVDLAREGLSS